MNRDTCGTCFAPSDLCKCTDYRFNNAALDEMQALTASEYRENTLVRLSNTHQQLEAALAKAESEEYEFIGCIDGTHGGRWVLTVKDKAAVWPLGSAVYVRRRKA